MDAPELHRTKVTDIAFRDPLSEETRKIRTHLLFAGVLAILVKTYDLKLSKAPWLEFEIPINAPQLLHGALSAILCYLLFVFVLYAWQDFRRWRLAGELHLVHSSFDLILKSRNDLFAIRQYVDKLTVDQPLQDSIRTAINAAAQQLPQSQAKLQLLASSLRRLNALQWFRVVVVEAALPVVLGVFALSKIFAALGPFLSAVVK
ncbi:MAG: hypothetical protein ACXWIN_07300 [Burkholderiaceae bacterium]